MEENEEDGQDQIKYLDAGMFHLHYENKLTKNIKPTDI